MPRNTTQIICQHCGTLVDSETPADQLQQGPEWERFEGTPAPLGASWINSEQAYNFAIDAVNASRVTLLLFREQDFEVPACSLKLDPLKNKSGSVWHCRVPLMEADDAVYYAYRIDGPAEPATSNWHVYDPDKILIDPYARSIFFPTDTPDRDQSEIPPTPLGRLDICRCPFDWKDEIRICHGTDLIIYEMHVRGFTQHPNSGVDDDKRGTFAGVVEKIPYLKELGVTAVELMPVFQFDPFDENYWGYMPLNFFAPHNQYSTNQSSCEQHSQFREMVRELHRAGIEVILDVVYNHTGEGDHRGPTYCYRGIDNATYYVASGNPSAPYANFSGTGNTLNTSAPTVRRLILDSLRYWAKEMHVDGFRFDLASVFSRGGDGAVNLNQPPLFDQIASDPDLAHVRLIAEPWDASGLYQLGKSFPGRTWMQWNGQFRDTLQQFVRGDRGLISQLMTRLYGSNDLFPDDTYHAFRPFQSINFITSHDGFTMVDLTAYNRKHNAANGLNNQDGPHDFSWNCGWEGNDQVPQEVTDLRKRQVKYFCCLLMLSNGSPMFRMGDEFMQTQGGNNNPFNQDNETSWLDWDRLKQHEEVFRFFKKMIAFRKSHGMLGSSTFWREKIQWYGAEQPEVDLSADSQCLAYHLHDPSPETRDLYVMINGSTSPVQFSIHAQAEADKTWMRVVDTSLPSPMDLLSPDTEIPLTQTLYRVNQRSIVVLAQSRGGTKKTALPE
ncbi:glycogen debranching protein [Gimesia chilikensis]|uniref:Glycogen debranching enzyme n=1 Tax=Gimesia chilikensis TaxID=2605989 RepID=A0A517PLN5_9PLAN|nr:isoamylase [Gimesia chilikensis]QDT20281.1 Glycogen debranching enzyme [Gimesia chilikensis]QDU02378.1 Glycogen debranching enzyme [Gimesia chilikensis]